MLRIFFLLMFLFGTIWGQSVTDVSQKVEKLLKENKYTEAEQILIQHKDSPRALYYLSVVQMAKGKLNKAIDLAKEGLEKSQEKAKFYELLGDIYAVKAQNSGMLSLAFVVPKIKKNWQKAIEADPKRISARQKLFSFFLMAPGFAGGDADKALEQAKETVKINPAYGKLMLGQYYQHQKQKEKAEQAFSEAEKLAPDSADIIREVGYYYLRNQDFPKAKAQFERIARLKPDSPYTYDNFADLYLKKGENDSALVLLKKAQRLAPTDIHIRFKIARVLANLGRFAQARQMAQELLQNEMFFVMRKQINAFIKEMDQKLKKD